MMDATTDQPATLLFRPGALGDTMLTVDAITLLRQCFPGEPVELVGNRDGGRLLARWGVVERWTAFDDPAVTGLFRAEPQVVDRWRAARRAVFWVERGRRMADAFARATSARVVCASPEPVVGSHVADHLVATIAPLMANAVVPSGPTVYRVNSPHAWSGAPGGPVLVHPGSGSPAKNWPAERFAELIRELSQRGPVAVLTGPADEDAVRRLLLALRPGNNQPSVVAPRDIVRLEETLRTCRLFIGNDSGVSHVSGRLGVPTLAIFGATDPERWAPRAPHVLTVGRHDAWPSVRQVAAALSRLERIADGSARIDAAGPPRARLDQDRARVESEEDEDREAVDHGRSPVRM